MVIYVATIAQGVMRAEGSCYVAVGVSSGTQKFAPCIATIFYNSIARAVKDGTSLGLPPVKTPP